MTDQRREADRPGTHAEKAPEQAPDEMAAAGAALADKISTVRPIHGFRRMMGYRTTVWRDRYSEVELVIDDRHDNSHGIVHGGVYAALLDAAFGGAVAYCGVPGRTRLAVTIQLQTVYMAPARRGVLRASARVIAVEGRVAVCEGEVRLDDGTLCATGTASFMYLHGSEQPEGVPVEMRKRKL